MGLTLKNQKSWVENTEERVEKVQQVQDELKRLHHNEVVSNFSFSLGADVSEE